MPNQRHEDKTHLSLAPSRALKQKLRRLAKVRRVTLAEACFDILEAATKGVQLPPEDIKQMESERQKAIRSSDV